MRRLGAAGLAAVLTLFLASLAPASAAAPAPAVPMRATQLSAGDGFACALLTDATVACFGSNAEGRLGLPENKPWALVAKRIAGLTGARGVAAGWDFGCVLLGGGHVRCFGDDRHDELGPGASQPWQWTPAPALPSLHGVVHLTAGYDHVCAVTSSRLVWCWGDNGTGELGVRPRALTQSGTPQRVPKLSGIVAISAGAGFTCAVRVDHTVWCWGENGSMQLGRPLTTPFDATPLRIPGVAAVGVAAGSGHVCALLVTREVACWGENFRGQLGLPTSVPYSRTARLVPGLGGVRAVDAGFDHTCALLEGGTMRCWGSDNDGQLGNGRANASDPPGSVRGIGHVTAMGLGVFFTCARESSGAVHCWGEGEFGQLGTGTRARLLRPGHEALVRAAE